MRKRNKNGFVFVETIVTITILLASVLSMYVYYNAFIIKEKKRLYYDDITYVYKTMALRDLIYKDVVYQKTESSPIYEGFDAIKKYLEDKSANKTWYSIGKSQTIFKISESPLIIGSSPDVYNLFEEYNITGTKSGFYYIPDLKDLKSKGEYPPNKQELKEYLNKLSIPCEDTSLTGYRSDHGECTKYKGIFISVINELKSGGSTINYTNYEECIKPENHKTKMECETVTYISWVYA